MRPNRNNFLMKEILMGIGGDLRNNYLGNPIPFLRMFPTAKANLPSPTLEQEMPFNAQCPFFKNNYSENSKNWPQALAGLKPHQYQTSKMKGWLSPGPFLSTAVALPIYHCSSRSQAPNPEPASQVHPPNPPPLQSPY